MNAPTTPELRRADEDPGHPDGPGPVRWRLDVRYDGADFSGWAIQRERRTVQSELELWLARVLMLPEPPRLVCAGRTDAGVHARGQVCHLDIPGHGQGDGCETLKRRLRRVLPPDIAVRSVATAAPSFDARFSAIWRRYCYRIVDDNAVPDPLERRHVAQVRYAVDLGALNAAAHTLIGLRDFAPFCRPREGATTIRTAAGQPQSPPSHHSWAIWWRPPK